MLDRPLVTDWMSDWDFYGSQYHEDPPSVWRELRQPGPLAHTDRYGGAWAAVRYDDVCAIAHEPETFSSRHTSVFDAYPENFVVYPPLTLDPPAHGPFRRLLLPQFGPRAVDELRPHTEGVCEDLLDQLAGRSEIDAAADYVRHIPVAVIASMLGVPDSEADLFRGWVHDMLEAVDSGTQIRATREALGYFREQLTLRRDEPGDDIVSMLAHSEVCANVSCEPSLQFRGGTGIRGLEAAVRR